MILYEIISCQAIYFVMHKTIFYYFFGGGYLNLFIFFIRKRAKTELPLEMIDLTIEVEIER